jgi:hypothetical protein
LNKVTTLWYFSMYHRFSPHVRNTYWTSLLEAAGSSDPKKIEQTRKEAEVAATKEVQNLMMQGVEILDERVLREIT